MTVDKMIGTLNLLKAAVGGNAEVPVVMVGYGENDYFVPAYPVVGSFEDQDGNKYSCAFVADYGGEEFTKSGTPHYNWKPIEDKLVEEVVKNIAIDNLLHVKLCRFYYEDAMVNGQEDNESTPTIPGYDKQSDTIQWDIDIETGKIMNWNRGTYAKTHYKVCDEFQYDYDGFHYDFYVPDFMSIDSKGYGDYVYLTIDEDGKIKNWNKTAFLEEHSKIKKTTEKEN